MSEQQSPSDPFREAAEVLARELLFPGLPEKDNAALAPLRRSFTERVLKKFAPLRAALAASEMEKDRLRAALEMFLHFHGGELPYIEFSKRYGVSPDNIAALELCLSTARSALKKKA